MWGRDRRHAYLGVGWLWYVVTLLPVIGLVQVGLQSRADRYTYVPLIGIFIMIAWGVPDLLARPRAGAPARRLGRSVRWLLAAASCAAIVALMACSWIQVGHWRDGVTLFEHALAVTPENEVAHGNLGVALFEQGRIDDALSHYYAALRINPEDPDAHQNLAIALKGLGRIDEAIDHAREAVRLAPNATTHTALGTVLMQKGSAEEAASEFLEALRFDPFDSDARNNLGVLLARAGRFDEAISHFEEVLRIAPGDKPARRNLERARQLEAESHQTR
jgi:Flp pilus assembly protein TadD